MTRRVKSGNWRTGVYNLRVFDLVGVILGGALGIGVRGFLSVRLGVTGGQGILLTLLTMGSGAGLLGSLFFVLHRVAILRSVFFSCQHHWPLYYPAA